MGSNFAISPKRLVNIFSLIYVAAAFFGTTLQQTSSTAYADALYAPCLVSGVHVVDDVFSGIFYMDDNITPSSTAAYIGYTITNSSAVPSGDIWVTLDNIGPGADIQLAPNESGVYHVGVLQPGEERQVYFYLEDTNLPRAGQQDTFVINESFNVNIYYGEPGVGGVEQCEYTDTITQVQDTINANANKVNATVAGPNPPQIGGILTMTVVGDTGTIGGSQILQFTPASSPGWNPSVFQLVDVRIEYWAGIACPNNPPGAVPAGAPTNTYDDVLFITSPTTSNSCYRVTYEFVARELKPTPTTISPVGYINSGTQIKHSPPLDILIDAVSTTGNVTLQKSVATSPANPGDTVTWTITLFNNRYFADPTIDKTIQLDYVVDTMPGTFTYVANSVATTCPNSTVVEPVISGQQLVFGGTIIVPGSPTSGGQGSCTITYNTLIPPDTAPGSYTNEAYALIGDVQFDTTVTLDDFTPATATVVVPGPDLQISKSNTVNGSVPYGSGFSWVLTVSNTGTSNGVFGAGQIILSDTLPAGLPYGTPVVSNALNVNAANISCSIISDVLTCSATAAVIIGSNGSFTVTIPVSPAAAPGTYTNQGATCSVDPGGNVNETNETNNNCADNVVTVLSAADLSVTKSDSPDPVVAGNNLTYTLTVTSAGPSVASTVSVEDTLPGGVVFVSATETTAIGFNCSETGGVVTCNAASMPVGSATIQIVVTVPAGTTPGTNVLSNTVTVTSAINDPTPGNNSDTELTSVDSNADLVVTKTDNPDPVVPGDDLTYTITVQNMGPSNAAFVNLQDALPTGTTFVSLSAPGGWSCTTPAVGANGTVNCSINDLPIGSYVFTLVVNVPLNYSGPLSIANSAIATSENDPNTSNNTGSATTTVGGTPDLSITKNDGGITALPGNTIAYTLTYANSGTRNASGVVITETVPNGTTFNAGASTAGWICVPDNNAGSTCTLAIGNLAASGGGSVTFAVTVNNPFNATSPISNTASIADDGNNGADPTPGNNSDSDTTPVSEAADLSVTKSDSPDPVIAGTNLAYTLTVTNAGPSVASSVSVEDTLPGGVVFVSATETTAVGFTCSETGGVVTCDAASMPVGSATIQIVVALPADTTPGLDVLSNTVTITAATTDPTPGNNSDTELTSVDQQADPTISKTDSPDPVVLGSNLTYTITVDNAGPSNSSFVGWSDDLPAGTTFVSLTQPGGWNCIDPGVGNNGLVACDIDNLPVGSQIFTLVVNVPADYSGADPIFNEAEVGAEIDSNFNNNTASTTTALSLTLADLLVTKTDSPDPVVSGNDLTYVITVNNQGPDDAENVSLNDTLPAGTNFVSLSAPPGWTCSDPGVGNNGLVTCAIATLPTGAYDIAIVVNVPVDYSGANPIANSATVTSDNDPDTSNNTGSTDTTVENAPTSTPTITPTAMTPTAIAPTSTAPTATPEPIILVFDPAISKVGQLEPGGLGLPGEIITWIVTVTNIGNGTGTNVVVSDTIRPELQIVDVTTGSGSVAVNGQDVAFSIPSLAPGASVQMTITTLVLSNPQSGQFENTVLVSGTGPGGALEQDSATATLLGVTGLPDTGYTPPNRPSNDHQIISTSIARWVVALVTMLMGGIILYIRKR